MQVDETGLIISLVPPSRHCLSATPAGGEIAGKGSVLAGSPQGKGSVFAATLATCQHQSE